MNVPVTDANGATKYLKAGGAGTDEDPYIVVQDVNIQDQTTPQFSFFLGQALNMNVTFRSTQSPNDEILNITSIFGPVIGNFLCIKEDEKFSQIEISSVVSAGTNDWDVGVSIPLDHEYTTGASVCLQNCDMAVDGASTPIEFFVSPQGALAGTAWDVTRMIINMTHSSQGDDGLFGNLAKLTNGTYFRVEDGDIYNLFNAKENSDFAIEGYDINYPTRSGGQGTAGTRSRITFNGRDKRGVVLRLFADSSDKFLACVRDDLTGLSSFRIKIQGQVVQD